MCFWWVIEFSYCIDQSTDDSYSWKCNALQLVKTFVDKTMCLWRAMESYCIEKVLVDKNKVSYKDTRVNSIMAGCGGMNKIY